VFRIILPHPKWRLGYIAGDRNEEQTVLHRCRLIRPQALVWAPKVEKVVHSDGETGTWLWFSRGRYIKAVRITNFDSKGVSYEVRAVARWIVLVVTNLQDVFAQKMTEHGSSNGLDHCTLNSMIDCPACCSGIAFSIHGTGCVTTSTLARSGNTIEF
jgi:hypothetical protein